MSLLGMTDEAILFDTRISTPASFPDGPVTDVGGQKALKPSIETVLILGDPKRPKFQCLEVSRNFVQSTTSLIMSLHAFKGAKNA